MYRVESTKSDVDTLYFQSIFQTRRLQIIDMDYRLYVSEETEHL